MEYQKTDEELMLAHKNGNEDALEMIIDRYKHRIVCFSYRFLGNLGDAEDVAQDVFLRVHQNVINYEPQAKFSTWIYTIAHNLCISLLRKRKHFIVWSFKRNSIDGDDDKEQDILDNSKLPNEKIEEKDVSGHIKIAIEKLPLEQKEVIIMREYQGLNYQEIADILNYSLVKVKILIYRARMNLKKKLLFLIEEGR